MTGDVQVVSVKACALHDGEATASAVRERVTPSRRESVGTREQAAVFWSTVACQGEVYETFIGAVFQEYKAGVSWRGVVGTGAAASQDRIAAAFLGGLKRIAMSAIRAAGTSTTLNCRHTHPSCFPEE